jgi:hypothetical protein
MQLTCEAITEAVTGFSLVEQCDTVRNGMVRISTPFRYPNGSNIDLFLRIEKPLLPESIILSDYGQTANYLADLHIKPWATKKRRQLIEDVCATLGIEQNAGQFLVRLDAQRLNEFSDSIVRLAQACVRISDLAYTQRIQTVGTFQEEIEEYISGIELQYEPEVSLTGIYGKEVKVDFRTQGKKVTSLIQTLATANPVRAHFISIEAFRRWFDLQEHKAFNQFITLYDSTNKVFREEDLSRLNDMSLVLGFPQDKEQFQEAISP